MTGPMIAVHGWWAPRQRGPVVDAGLAALVVSVITIVNRIEGRAGSIPDHLTATRAVPSPVAERSLVR